VVAVLGLSLPCPSARAAPWLIPPVDGPVTRSFEPPDTRWGPGHRGIDYSTAPGAVVRAAAAGAVSFAGGVAGHHAVSIDHGGGLTSTYSELSSILVARGDIVDEGHWIGHVGTSHEGATGGLHLGVKLDGHYVDPLEYLGPVDASSAIHLAPLVPDDRDTAVVAETACRELQPAGNQPRPPNRNIAVEVAGIGSKTMGGTSAALYETGEALLGYPSAHIYRFSYRGHGSSDLHEPYARTDTFGDIAGAAVRLRELLRSVAARHPRADVDLIAHSQGGIVARTYLELVADAWDPGLPRIAHLVTFSTPHGGAPGAAGVPVLRGGIVGRVLLGAASGWARNGGPIPDPYSPAVTQLAPGSELMDRLDGEAVMYGTRVLTLAIPNDVVVPADRARWDHYPGVVVPPAGLNGHDAVVTSPLARAAAHAFLRDAPPACRSVWDVVGPPVGAGIGLVERALPWGIRALDAAALHF
jgi:Peptidase family M23/Putative serine esterase (DUF676)